MLGDGSWYLSCFRHPSWLGSVTSGCHKYFQHHLLKNHLVWALYHKKPIVSAFPFVWSFYAQHVPFFFSCHSLLGELSVIHFSVDTCQGDLLIRVLFALAHLKNCDVMWGVFRLVFFLPLMTFTSFFFLLKFLFFTRFLWGLWSSLASVWLGCLLVFLLGALLSFFSHFSWGDWLHFHKVLCANNSYLGSTTFVAPIKFVAKFSLDSSPFLLEAIGINNFGLFPFYTHLKLVQEFLVVDAVICILPFVQFVEKKVYRL